MVVFIGNLRLFIKCEIFVKSKKEMLNGVKCICRVNVLFKLLSLFV